MATVVSSKDFIDKKVYRAVKNRKGEEVQRSIGHVRSCVYHPEANICVGVMVKRPDAALMFHRPDAFVALDRLTFQDKELIVSTEPASMDKAACKRLGIDVDQCVIWSGLAVITRDQERLGYVGQVHFDMQTGEVQDVVVNSGAAKDALLGKFVLPGNLIKGFCWGVGDVIVMSQNSAEEDDSLRGGLVVDARAKELATQGGAAAAAGKATAVAADKARKVKVKVKPKVDEGLKVAGQATDKGLYVTGRQLGRTRGMFSAFKEEYKKGLKGD